MRLRASYRGIRSDRVPSVLAPATYAAALGITIGPQSTCAAAALRIAIGPQSTCAAAALRIASRPQSPRTYIALGIAVRPAQTPAKTAFGITVCERSAQQTLRIAVAVASELTPVQVF